MAYTFLETEFLISSQFGRQIIILLIKYENVQNFNNKSKEHK